MLKLREVANNFYKKEVGNGRHISYWYDNWSANGVLIDPLGERGITDMDISRDATVEDAVLNTRRRRRHRTLELNNIEAELLVIKEKRRSNVEDVALWKRKSCFKSTFSTQETWMLTRETKPICNWAKGIWFPQATPKFVFVTWLAMDRVLRRNQGVDAACVLCKIAVETRNYLFYECSYASQVWEHLAKVILRSSYTNIWSESVILIMDGNREKNSLFCIRYAFQASVHALWKERNKIKYGDKLLLLSSLKKFIDKGVRNQLSLMRSKGNKGREEILEY
ncbi:uncharacterized protein LOC106369675 [Brassica napus]|uniref:uncharacterized protein LOC106369675 n=1 Tax=Brassica napus TaxID=3708 RepID=UPI0006AB2A49|nr:uncharacterized protein LOC106369675 [Brassica napus]